MSPALSPEPKSASPSVGLQDAYLNLCKEHLTRGQFVTQDLSRGGPLRHAYLVLDRLLGRAGLQVVRTIDEASRFEGREASSEAETMIGRKRLDNLQQCVTQVLRDDVPGDLIETGVWRGGASIFMRAVLLAYGNVTRTVWVADSFEGLPKPDPDRYPADRGDRLWEVSGLAISLDQVMANFSRYGLLDEQVQFLPGWFSETLPSAPIDRLSILRLDGDMYESTKVALESLYPKLSVGGYVIVDDYGAIDACRQAVADFRGENGVEEEIRAIDWTGVYWRRRA